MKKHLRVLLADTNEELRPHLTKAMGEDGEMELLEVTTNGKETVRLCDQLKPDVLLLELVLPELDGLAVLRKLREKKQKIAVIILTGFATPMAVSMAMEAGADYFLSKPCMPEIITERIRFFGAAAMPTVREKQQREIKSGEIAELLREMGISPQLKGYRYLTDAISTTIAQGGELQMVTKCLYPAIAKHYASTAARVERAIRHAVEIGWKRGNPELIRVCFGNSASADTRPTNSQFIAAVSVYLIQKIAANQ